MRAEFIQTLVDLAVADPRILLLTADIGYTVLEPFAERFPKRFFNVGVAEQNMVGMATGLAREGYIPFLYSIVNFSVLRPYEFIRNGPVYHQLPVRIVGVGEAFDYGPAGITHYGVEDVGVMRLQPGLTVVVPSDGENVKTALKKTWDLPGPVYYRLGKGTKNPVKGVNGKFELGRLQLLKRGSDVLFVCMGSISGQVVEAAEELTRNHVAASVALLSSFNPAPLADLKKILSQYSVVLAVEEHYVTGALGSLVCEVVAEEHLPCRVVRCGVTSLLKKKLGSKNFMLSEQGLSAKQLAATALAELKKGPHG